jgi:hypothetical protein
MESRQAMELINSALQDSESIGIRLKLTKPFTPNDFPAVQIIENAIKDLPVEHHWYFDSSGMPYRHDVGNEKGVLPLFEDPELRNLPSYKHKEFYSKFWSPVAFGTHNHPTSNNPEYNIYPVGQRYAPLSAGDYLASAYEGLPIRAINSEYGGGVVYQFNPGYATDNTLEGLFAKQPFLPMQSQSTINRELQSQDYKNFLGKSVNKAGLEKPSMVEYKMPDYVESGYRPVDSFTLKNGRTKVGWIWK